MNASQQGSQSPQKIKSFYIYSAQPQDKPASPDISDQQKRNQISSFNGSATSASHVSGQASLDKQNKIKQFREQNKMMKSEGILYCQALKDIQETLQGKELIDNFKIFGS